MKNPAREKFLPMLSPYVDGELTPEERQLVEQHLANSKESAAQVADFRAADGLMRHALEMQADSMDWKAFADDVMAKVTPEKLPLFERLKLSLSEMFTYQRGPLMVGFAAAALAVLIAVPVTMKFATPDGYGASKVQVQMVSVKDTSSFKPVVMETDTGDAIIWVVESTPDGGKKKKDGEHSEETLTQDPPLDGKQGDL
ncbi:MAG: zf-HC2 domain-containing protein [Archangium sp.]|nr:zf-HC2 domain-containing protein [Archangium sp.]MDP3158090.1 zf-HC2 domain-containing protein [Archangium sp.]MDP3570503.1 zf-HC2 domain-containing protein [Archangium sp.]